ncbi:MazG-like family protein [Wolbachia endosymbiont of Cantharis cryptica]|uniref:MazG-like family protein n=1 Tax=Wolbachia endosymbiont of Cantharis cryptica TaxID=3066132 RepID=UPI00376ED53B
MEKDEYIERLKDKLLEEAKEVIASKTPDENLEELADLLEVIHTLGKESGLSIEQIEEKRISKKQESDLTQKK